MNPDPVRAHENLNAQLRHQFRFAFTFFQSWFMLIIIIGVPLGIPLLFEDEVDTYPSDWVFIILMVLAVSMVGAFLITGWHYWYERRRMRSIREKPLRNLIAAGAEVREGNVISQHNGYLFNIAWMGHQKKLQTGTFVVHVYYQAAPAIDHLRKKHSSKLSEWSKIRFNHSYLRFYYTKVIFQDSFKSFQRQMDQWTTLLAENDIRPTEKKVTKIQMIPEVGFDEALSDVFSKSI